MTSFLRPASALLLTVGFLSGTAAPVMAATLSAAPAVGSTASVNGTPGARITVKEGTRTVVSGEVPARFANSVVALEATQGRDRFDLATGLSNGRGRVSVALDLGGSGSVKVRWRVLKDGKVAWSSRPFTVVVAPRADRAVSDSSSRMAAAAGAADRTRTRAAVKGVLPSDSGSIVRTDVFQGFTNSFSDATSQVAADAAKGAGQGLGDYFASDLAQSSVSTALGFATDGLSFGLRKLFHIGSKTSQEQQDFEQLSSEIQTGFSQVQSQLTAIEGQLSTLEQQVSNVQQQVVTGNASAASTSCVADMNTANGYVDQIKTAVGDFETVLDPAWMQANLVGQPRKSAMNLVGVEIFGAGPGQPPFTSGVVQLQTAVTALGDLLTSGGPNSSAGLIATCASAVSAGVAAANLDATIVAPGSLAAAYYSNMHAIASYYASWLALGQRVTSEGGQLSVVSLAGDSYDGGAPICRGVTGSPDASINSCPGVVWYTTNAMAQFSSAMNLVGASWDDVTMGYLAGDNRIPANGDFIAPAQSLWVRDIATYGQAIPGAGPSSSSGSASPLTSTTVPSSTAPAATSAGSTSLGQPSWFGFTFSPATTNQWDQVIPGSSHPGGTAGALMKQAGLLNAGQPPSDLVLLTGETSSFSTNQDTTWNSPVPCPDGYGCGSFPSFPNQSLTALSFIDTNLVIPSGNPVVVGPPAAPASASAWGTPMYANDVMAGADQVAAADSSCTTGTWSEKCGATSTQTFSLTAPAGVTNAPGFWNPLTQVNTWDYNLARGQDGGSFNVSNPSTSISSTPGFMSQATAYGAGVQYAWPASPLNESGQPAGSTCSMTSFTTGTDGNAGIGNVCQNLFNEWLAGAVGVNTGQISITGGSVQTTVTPSGNYAATAYIYNTGNAATVSVFFSILSGDASLTGLVNSSTSGVNVTGCSKSSKGLLECQVTVPSGASALTVPLGGSFSSGRLLSGLSGGSSYSSSNTYLLPVGDSAAMLTPAMVDVTAGPDTWADQNQPNGGAPMYASLRWTLPGDLPLPLTGFAIYITDPNGKQVRQVGQAYPPKGPIYVVNESDNGQPFAANDLAGIDLPLPSNTAGVWTIGVAGINAAGEGPVVSAKASIGDSKPVAPSNFQSVEEGNGTVRLTWDPVNASPAVTNYEITVTSPTGTTSTVVSDVPARVLQNINALGTWTFSLTAVNPMGKSPQVQDTLNVVGQVPTEPLNLDMTVDGFGWVSASWSASDSVPTADTYYVALYAPGATSATAPTYSTKISAPIKVERIRLANFYQLAKDSPSGSWLLAITAVNSVGVGDYAATQLVASPGLIQQVTKERAEIQTLDSIPARLLQRAAALCSSGAWSQGMNVFGTCSSGTFTPADPTWSAAGSASGGTSSGSSQQG